MVPRSWRESPELAEVLRVAGLFADRLRADLDLVAEQLGVEMATVGLEGWEQTLGLDSTPSLPPDTRRSRIKARLQGLGVTTLAVLVTIAERYTGGVAHVEETPEAYRFRVVVDGLLNPPGDMESLRRSIAEIKPAHLATDYAFQLHAGHIPARYVGAVQQVKHYHFEGGDTA